MNAKADWPLASKPASLPNHPRPRQPRAGECKGPCEIRDLPLHKFDVHKAKAARNVMMLPMRMYLMRISCSKEQT